MRLTRRHRRRHTALLLGALLGVVALPVVAASPASASGTVTVVVKGPGQVTGEGIDCTESGGPDCSEDVAFATNLTAVPLPGYAVAWTDCPVPAGESCLLVSGPATVTATFTDVEAPAQPVLDPAGGTVNGTLVVTAATTDNSGTVQRVKFFQGSPTTGVQIGADTAAPYQVELYSPAFTDGALEITAVAIDAAGNESQPGTGTYTIDNGPTTEIVKAPKAIVSTERKTVLARFEFAADEEDATFACTLDGVERACGETASFRVSRGRHVLTVAAVDADGRADPTPKIHRWKVVRRR